MRYHKAAEALRSGGYLATWGAGHVMPDDGDSFFDETQEVYDYIGEGLFEGTSLARPDELGDHREETEASGMFEVVEVRRFVWETTYDSEGYIDLLETFSGHIAMEEWLREHPLGEIRHRLGRRPKGLPRHWGAVLHVARKSGP